MNDRQKWETEQETKFKDLEIIHFQPHEFYCRCGFAACSWPEMDMAFIGTLDSFRDFAGMPFRISSGARCSLHINEATKNNPGPHQTGQAADIVMNGVSVHRLLYLLGQYTDDGDLYPFTGIGLDQNGDFAQRFIHLDQCEAKPYRPRPHVWTY